MKMENLLAIAATASAFWSVVLCYQGWRARRDFLKAVHSLYLDVRSK